ncbi:shikimate kinase [Campylobacter iguaniorum]|uniref:shikimate kinase n=1 Tax=Campylobacter iguaniorum TaxID=1244531 RepID=UPI00073A2E15|nr:shikimate kinase [Campylobacter iguaniorum]ALV25101.1 shikimate kinase [Campylobacter iguaniorum]
MSTQNIVLSGFMGSGKSTIAKALATNLDKFMLDCDYILEGFNAMKAKDMRAKFGDLAFKISQEKMFLFLKNSVKNSVIATGGNMHWLSLNELGVNFYLKTSFETIIDRLSKDKNELEKRPIFQDMQKACKLHVQTQDKFSQMANFTIVTDDKSIELVKDEILNLIKEKL